MQRKRGGDLIFERKELLAKTKELEDAAAAEYHHKDNFVTAEYHHKDNFVTAEYHHKDNFVTAEYCDNQGQLQHGRLQMQAPRTLKL
jgi:hypothetical protein